MPEPLTDLHALPIRQPWAWAIAYGGKNVQNRSWRAPLWCTTITTHAGARQKEQEQQGEQGRRERQKS